ncbi:MAG: ATP-dependent Clp protease adaptor ClpS [Myxococcales bacterium]|nr:ATP-dependent Clp protease adaptor ClpS [Myxococcales bacterium]
MPTNDPPPPPDRQTGKGDPGAAVKDRVKKPRNFKVVLHNDDYTTMEFVIWVLIQIFRKSQVEAGRIMLTVHRNGKGVAGIYSKEVAETKAAAATDAARSAGYPLLVEAEPE